MASPPPEWLEERRRLGLDRHDEVWDGVLHVPPLPTPAHQSFASDLEFALRPLASARGLRLFREVAIYALQHGEANYRGPDLVVTEPVHVSLRGIEARATIAIEVLSPGDESRDKLPFYAGCGIPEVWLVDPESRQPEVYVLRKNVYFAVAGDSRTGIVRAPALDLELAVVDGPKLRLAWRDGSAEI